MNQNSSEDQQLAMEQYKLYVEMADRVSARRADVNKFYITLLTSLLALFSIITKTSGIASIANFLMIVGSIFGIILCLIWLINIRSYRQLNSGKFKVIQKMEERLPFSCFKSEWEILGKGKSVNSYFALTKVEQCIPISFAILYLLLIFYLISLSSNINNIQ